MEHIDQGVLQNVARQCTSQKPPRPKFTCSAAARTLRDIAKRSRQPGDWKLYLQQMRRDRDGWRQERLSKAVTGWTEYRDLTKTKKGWGDSYLMNNADTDPMEGIGSHFAGVFAKESAENVDACMDALKDTLSTNKSPPFSTSEVRRAIFDGKSNRSVGPDMVPTELLKEIVTDEVSLESFTRFFNQLMHDRQVPAEWSTAIVTLLSRTGSPQGPADLRPITLASHVAKAFTRLLMQRQRVRAHPGKTVPR